MRPQLRATFVLEAVAPGNCPAAQRGHRQDWRRWASGMAASATGATSAVMHQQLSGARPAVMAHWLLWPHKGQRSGSVPAGAVEGGAEKAMAPSVGRRAVVLHCKAMGWQRPNRPPVLAVSAQTAIKGRALEPIATEHGTCAALISSPMGRHPKVLGDALFCPLQCSSDAGQARAKAVPQPANPTVAGSSGLGGARGGGWRRCWMRHGRDVLLRAIIRKVEFNEALLQKF